MRNMKNFAAAAVMLAAIAAPSIAMADYYNPPRDKMYRKGFDGPGSVHAQVPFGFDESRDQDKVTVVHPTTMPGVYTISETDRKEIRGYLARTYRSECPAGTVKVGRECSTNDNVNQVFVVGQPIPAAYVVQPAPVELVQVLRPVPVGYRYVTIDGNVLLVNSNGVIVDTVTYY